MEIREKLKNHIDGLFKGAPESRAVYELKEELLVNSIERYNDMLDKGMVAEDAYNSVIANIGNVDELIAALPRDAVEMVAVTQEQRQRSAVTKSIAVGLYILGVMILCIGSLFGQFVLYSVIPQIGALALAFIVCIIATCLLVYNAQRYPKYKKNDNSVVESFKQFNSDAKRRRSIVRAISMLMWCFMLVVYFLVSFKTMAWYISWVTFLIGGCFQAAILLVANLKGMD